MQPKLRMFSILLFVSVVFQPQQLKAQQYIQATPSRFIAYSLYNFSKFIDWPSGTVVHVFEITVVGDKNVYQELMELSKNKKQGEAYYKVNFAKNVEEMKGFSHIVYLSNLQSGKVKELSKAENTKGVLFVTEREGMANFGSTISFTTNDNGQMGFEIARSNAGKHNLVIQKQLEKLASKVI